MVMYVTTSLIDVEYNFFVASIDFKTNHAIFYLNIYIFEFGFVFDGHYILHRRYYSQLYSFFQFWFNGNSIWKNVSNSSSELAVLIRTEGIFSNNCWNTPLFKSGNDEVWSFERIQKLDYQYHHHIQLRHLFPS